MTDVAGGPASVENLTEVERAVRDALVRGQAVDLRPATADGNDGAPWVPERTVRGELLRDLLLSEAAGGAAPTLRLRGARITGRLDLEGASLSVALDLRDCSFEQGIKLNEARAPAVRLWGCSAPSLEADQLETRGNLELREFVAYGEVRLRGARIGGRLDLSGAQLANPAGRALDGYGLRADQGMFCRDGFSAQGEVSLIGAHIGGQLDFSGADVTANEDGHALTADRITVDGAMFARAVNTPEYYEWFAATGEVRLSGAHIRGNLDLTNAVLDNRAGIRALAANGLTVDQDLYMDGVTAKGQVRLLGAHVGGSIGFPDADFANGDDIALQCERLTVDQDLFANRLKAEGGVTLAGARIGGLLDFSHAAVAQAENLVLDLERVRAAELILLPEEAPAGTVSLDRAEVGRFTDHESTWPHALVLRGFTYELLGGESTDVEARLRWLELERGGYVPDAYDQLSVAYLRHGRDEDARRVRIAKQRRRRGELQWPGRLWNDLLRWTVGYGYRPWYAGLWLGLLAVIGALVFGAAYPENMSATAEPAVLPPFHAFAYALDVLLPIVDLGQQDRWNPQGAAQWWSYVSILSGWVLSTAVVAALTGLLKKD
jgi:hypothetical protein